jgi:uncharacterized protein YcnI
MTGRRFAAAALLAAALVLATPLAAQAHVRVSPEQAADGAAWTELAFAVPAEQTAATVALEVRLDVTHPFLNLYVRPMTGWSSTVRRTPLTKPVDIAGKRLTDAPSAVVWHADAGAELQPGQFLDFDISVGPMPKVGSLRMEAVQTLADGTTVRWTDPIPRKGTMPEHPAPTVWVDDDPPALKGGMAGMAGMGGMGTTAPVAASTASASQPAASTTLLPLALAALAVVLGAAGLVAGLVALRRTRARAG